MQMDRSRILVATIFGEVKNYVIRDWYKNVRQFTHPGFDLCAVDNSKDKKYHKKIFNHFSERKKNSNILNISVLHTPRVHKEAEMFMAFSANALRNYFLRHNYDWLLYVECDIFPPKDILERLLAHDKEIMSALFFTGSKRMSYPMIADIHTFINDAPKITMKGYLEGFFHIGEWDAPQNVLSAGLGCVLIYKDLIKTIPFRAHEHLKHHHDTTFTKDLWENGYQNAYVPVMCRHENQTWDVQRKLLKKY